MCIFAAMKHLLIHNLGPLKEANIELKRINVIIGSQSSGSLPELYTIRTKPFSLARPQPPS